MYQVNNVSKHFRNYKYVVIRDCRNEPAPWNGFYYWGAYNDLETAHRACDECGNGFIAESENVEPLSYGGW